MLDEKRKEKILKELEKMKKSELIEYIIDMIESQEDKSRQFHELMGDLAAERDRVEELEHELSHVKKNDRGAGRKEKFDDEQIDQILKARIEGKSIRIIAKEFGCSPGLVHKLIKAREGEVYEK